MVVCLQKDIHGVKIYKDVLDYGKHHVKIIIIIVENVYLDNI